MSIQKMIELHPDVDDVNEALATAARHVLRGHVHVLRRCLFGGGDGHAAVHPKLP